MKTRASGASAVLLACFVLSGVSGLVYEVVWSRKLTLVFGSTTLAVSLCLAAYLGGMAFGAYVFGRFADRIRRPAAVYGLMELGIGAYGILSGSALGALGPWYLALCQWLELPESALFAGGVVQFALVALALLLPTALMGGTLPVLTRADASNRLRLGARVGRLYAANTAGAALGAWLAGFVLLPRFGLQQSLVLAGAVNVGLGLLVVAAFGRAELPRAAIAKGESARPSSMRVEDLGGRRQTSVLSPAALGLLVLLSGFCALHYEVVWTRALELVLGSSTRAFSLMLATFLIGLTAGLALSGIMVRQGWRVPQILGPVQLAVGVSVFATTAVVPRLPDWFLALYLRDGADAGRFLLWQAGLCASILFVPSLLIGMVFPLVVEDAKQGAGREANLVGRLYALNTLGCIAGALAAGLLVIPSFGLRHALLLGVWLNLGLASLIAACAAGTDLPRRLRDAAVPLLVGGLLATNTPTWDPVVMTSGVYFNTQQIAQIGLAQYHATRSAIQPLFYRDGPTGTVAILKVGSLEILTVNGRGEGGTRAKAQVLLGHLPFILGRPIREVFVVGLGTGSTAGALTLHPVRRIEVAELEPAVVEAAGHFSDINHQPLQDPRVRVRAADARALLMRADRSSYDLIVSQPSYPWVSGSSKLFTLEFYQLARSRLRPSGVLAQWIQLYNMDFLGVGSLLKTVTTVFPYLLVIEIGDAGREIVLLGSAEPVAISWTHLQGLFADPIRASDLGKAGVHSASGLIARVLLGPKEAAALAEKYPLNTDDNGLLEFTAAPRVSEDTAFANLQRLRNAGGDPWIHVRESAVSPTPFDRAPEGSR